jgi:hypothetical protein
MRQMDPDDHDHSPVQAVFDCAKEFGLTDREVLRTINGCLSEAGSDATVAEFVDQLTGALARNILRKEQRTFSKEPGAPSDRRAHTPGHRPSSV